MSTFNYKLSSNLEAMPNGWISVGVVRSVNPVRRELRIAPYRGKRHWFDGLEWLGIAQPGRTTPLRCKTARMRWHGDLAIVELSPGVARETVASLKGADVLIPETQRPAVNEDWRGEALLHFRVRTVDGEWIGEIVDVLATAAHDVLEIAPPSGKRILVPAIPEVIQEIAWEEGVVMLHDITPYAVQDAD